MLIDSISQLQNVTFDTLYNIGDDVSFFNVQIIFPFRHRSALPEHGIKLPKGLLLHGPSGCGKTSMAIALIRELGIPLIIIAANEVHQKILGQGERHLRNMFTKARQCSPCAILLENVIPYFRLVVICTHRDVKVGCYRAKTRERRIRLCQSSNCKHIINRDGRLPR